MPNTPDTDANHSNAILPQGFLMPSNSAQNNLPLQGVTILAVEDSRFACEALRLMAMRSGARLRRADSLKSARDHLRVYRPDVVIIDLGLPDGRGEALIRDLVVAPRRPKLVLGTSGNADGRATSLAAGADDYIDKPLESLSLFCDTLRGHLPGLGLSTLREETITPDPLALQDDLALAARSLASGDDPALRRYVTGFLIGVANHAHDTLLCKVARDAASPLTDMQDLRRLIGSRLAATPTAFGKS